VLERAVTDFGADTSFAMAVEKLVEHYGVLLPESTVRRITERHAQQISEQPLPSKSWPKELGVAQIIAEMDGGMVPIMEPSAAAWDKRKGKKLHWKEAKLCLAHVLGSKTLHYGGTLEGGVDDAGDQLFQCAQAVGFGSQTQVHAVGDGADWIALQVADKFGENGEYLVDFYHVCEYLSAAANSIIETEAGAKTWLKTQTDAMKSGGLSAVLATLAPHVEAVELADALAPVRCCHRYLSKRHGQLNYQAALAAGLPIGSGEVESAHRYVVQQRLKRQGAWWRMNHAQHMLALRIRRANRQWGRYWGAQMMTVG